MAEIIKFVRRSGAAPVVRDRLTTATEPASNDRVLVLISHLRYWEVLASVARYNGEFEKAQHFETRGETLFDEITRTKANTIEGAIAQLQFLFPDSPDWVELIAAGLRKIAANLVA